MKNTQRTFVLTLAVIALVGLSANNASAQNDGNVSVSTGIDFVNDYYFRGIVQETKGSISQPYIEAGLAVNDNVSLTAGTWQSLHSEQDKTSTVPSGMKVTSTRVLASEPNRSVSISPTPNT
ncbi:MAG: hypothetical protein Ct9H300mP25_09250 [Acidobacteriota bacterium]|nr:MAG: hypothetical protein Ct9H300mP25_09250 [Acidobacteriota bacterium]